MPINPQSSGRFPSSAVIKGEIDATLAANLPSNPQEGDLYIVNTAGSFENSSLILPASVSFNQYDRIVWSNSLSKWIKSDASDNITDSPTWAETIDAPSARAAQSKITTDIGAHAALTTSHGVTGDLVGTSDTQTLINKSISGSGANIITNLNESSLTAAVSDKLNHVGQKWYQLVIPTTSTTLGYTYLEDIRITAASFFRIMVRKSSEVGTDISHFGVGTESTVLDSQIQSLFADAHTDISLPNGCGDSITGTVDIVTGAEIISQPDPNNSNIQTVKIFVNDGATPTASRYQLTTGIVIYISTNTSVNAQARYADFSDPNGSGNFELSTFSLGAEVTVKGFNTTKYDPSGGVSGSFEVLAGSSVPNANTGTIRQYYDSENGNKLTSKDENGVTEVLQDEWEQIGSVLQPKPGLGYASAKVSSPVESFFSNAENEFNNYSDSYYDTNGVISIGRNSLLIQSNSQVDGTSVFTDSYGNVGTITPTSTTHSTTYSVFGTSSIHFANGGSLSLPVSTYSNLHSHTKWTMEFQRLSSLGLCYLYSVGNTTNGYQMIINGGTTFLLRVYTSGSYTDYNIAATFVKDTTFRHYEITYDSGTISTYRNGALIGSVYVGVLTDPGADVTRKLGSGSYQLGYIDQFRIVTGHLFHTTSFTPPALAYNSTPVPKVRPIISYTGLKTFSPSSLVLIDESDVEITANGKVNVDYQVDGGGFAGPVDLNTFKALGSSIFIDISSLDLEFTLVDLTIGVKSSQIDTPSTAVVLKSVGELDIGINGVSVLSISKNGLTPVSKTTTERDAIPSPAPGLFIFNSTTNKLNFYNGTSWEAVTSV